MAAGVLIELVIGFFFSLGVYAFALVQLHNYVMQHVFTSGMVISMFNAQIGDSLAWIVIGAPLFILIGTCFYAYADIVYKTGG